ncbi:metal ABC transporter solute-binding protein, Zn/Mn family [Alteribacillus sp. JSM 102045]|uniref:metal ABC transporter solute-binding protein, Zn/Mn family n=1 Tax=Alteribacillus sp. JSM 102045 TaxID=1562101 RepID=UPI0035C08DD4
MIKFLSTVLAGSFFILSACGKENPAGSEAEPSPAASDDENQPLTLATNIFAIEDFIEHIGGEQVEVNNIVPPGTDAHTYEPTIKEITDMVETDRFLYTTGSMEGLNDTILPLLINEDVTTVDVAEDIEKVEYQHHEWETENTHSHSHTHGNETHTHEHSHEEEDTSEAHIHGPENPHVWIDPIKAIEIAHNIKDVLIEVDPDHSPVFKENTEQLEKKLRELDMEFKEAAKETDKHSVFVAHPGYTYWAERYDFDEISITETVSSNEPSQKRMQTLIEKAEKENIQYVAFEKSFAIGTAKNFAEEIGAQAVYFNNLESLHEESQDASYFSLMRENIDSLEKLLNE